MRREKVRRKGFHPDLIVLDLSMPVMNGIDEARVLEQLLRVKRNLTLCDFLDSSGE